MTQVTVLLAAGTWQAAHLLWQCQHTAESCVSAAVFSSDSMCMCLSDASAVWYLVKAAGDYTHHAKSQQVR